jgi:hypothetical protein
MRQVGAAPRAHDDALPRGWLTTAFTGEYPYETHEAAAGAGCVPSQMEGEEVASLAEVDDGASGS